MRAAAAIDRFTGWLGVVAGVAAVLAVALMFGLVVARYLFAVGSIAVQEAVLWLHSILFLLGMAYALKHDQHVRVDVFAQRWPARTRAAVELAGLLLFVLPFCAFVAWISLDYVQASWAIREASREPGGLPALYALKALIPLAAVVLALQALANAARAFASMRTHG